MGVEVVCGRRALSVLSGGSCVYRSSLSAHLEELFWWLVIAS